MLNKNDKSKLLLSIVGIFASSTVHAIEIDTGIFVPAGHKHLVQPSRQLNLFFDTSVDWLTELFGGHLDISHGRVLDRDTLQGIQSCFYQSEDLAHSMSVFASAFELRTRVRMDPLSLSKWEPILETAKQLKANDALIQRAS